MHTAEKNILGSSQTCKYTAPAWEGQLCQGWLIEGWNPGHVDPWLVPQWRVWVRVVPGIIYPFVMGLFTDLSWDWALEKECAVYFKWQWQWKSYFSLEALYRRNFVVSFDFCEYHIESKINLCIDHLNPNWSLKLSSV